MTQTIQDLSARVTQLIETQKLYKKQISEVDTEIKELSRSQMNLKKAASFADLLIEKLNQTSIGDIEILVTEALQFIFEEPYEFKMNPVVKRGNVTYNFTLTINGVVQDDIMNAEGGGIVQVISVLMRIVTILISKGMKRVLFLDESLGMLSKEYIGNASKFIKDLGDKLDFTIVLITHEPEFLEHATTAYRIEKGRVIDV